MKHPPNHPHRPPHCRATLSYSDHVDRAIGPPKPEGPPPVRFSGIGTAMFADAPVVILVAGPPAVRVRATVAIGAA